MERNLDHSYAPDPVDVLVDQGVADYDTARRMVYGVEPMSVEEPEVAVAGAAVAVHRPRRVIGDSRRRQIRALAAQGAQYGEETFKHQDQGLMDDEQRERNKRHMDDIYRRFRWTGREADG